MFEDMSDKVLKAEFVRLTKLKNECGLSINNILSEMKKRESFKEITENTKRAEGDTWVNDESEWFGMSPEGVSGPWNNRQAAEAASKGHFKSAGSHNVRNYLK